MRLLLYGLLCLFSLAIVGALTATGIILTIAMLMALSAISLLLTSRFPRMLALEITLAVAASLLGVYLSFFFDNAPAPAIALLLTAAFVAALLSGESTGARLEPWIDTGTRRADDEEVSLTVYFVRLRHSAAAKFLIC